MKDKTEEMQVSQISYSRLPSQHSPLSIQGKYLTAGKITANPAVALPTFVFFAHNQRCIMAKLTQAGLLYIFYQVKAVTKPYERDTIKAWFDILISGARKTSWTRRAKSGQRWLLLS